MMTPPNERETQYLAQQLDNERTNHRLDLIVDELRMDNVRITTTLSHVESDLKSHKDEVHTALGKLNEKIDNLSAKFSEVGTEVKVMAAKIALGAIALGMVLQVLGKHFGLI